MYIAHPGRALFHRQLVTLDRMSSSSSLPLVPLPAQIECGTGTLLVSGFRIVLGNGLHDDERWLGTVTAELSGSNIPVSTGNLGDGLIDLRLELLPTPPDPAEVFGVYELDIVDHVRITARDRHGILNGLRTLNQLAQRSPLPRLKITDEPRYLWRGLSVDVVRHWYGFAALIRIVELISAYKLNYLHLHLTDDQGWRIEIPTYPALTELSSRSQVGGLLPESERGYLTLAEYRDLQEYAASRGVTIVPEIDLPGHTRAALHAIPELNDDGIAPPLYFGTEVGHSLLRLANPATKPFIETVINTVSENTLGEWIHIGGDESPLLADDEYRALVGIANEAVLANGKRAVAWQEAAKLATVPSPTGRAEPFPLLQFWIPIIDLKPLFAALGQGARLIMSPGDRAYLDMKYDDDDPLGLAWAGTFDLAKARSWDPESYLAAAAPTGQQIPQGVIHGVEAAVWSETCRSLADLEALLFPRLAAIAEVAWSGANGQANFIERLKPHAALWRKWGFPASTLDRLAAASDASS